MRQKGQPKIRAFDIRGENPGVHFLFNQTGVAQSSYPPFQYVFNELRTRRFRTPLTPCLAGSKLFDEVREAELSLGVHHPDGYFFNSRVLLWGAQFSTEQTGTTDYWLAG